MKILLISTIFFRLFVHGDHLSGRARTIRCSHINYETSDDSCSKYEFCSKTFNISYVYMPPYSPSTGVEEYIRLCCGNCTKVKLEKIFPNSSVLTPLAIRTSHFVYPFLSSVTDDYVNGYHFIPVMHCPRAYYITARPDIGLFHSVLHLYPLVTICILMAMFAGFICWMTETWKNPKEFPREFPFGWFEGFWWSFVSMTTVGYGDKSPKTFVGRLFAIVWIFTGITVCGILTAMLTTRIMEANTPPKPSVFGSKVGILKDRLYDSLLVAHHGGIFVPTDSTDFGATIYELIRKLRAKEIDGILLDKYTLWSIVGNFPNVYTDDHTQKEKEIKFFMRDTIKSTLEYRHEALAYGILVKHEADYEFIRDIVRGNRFNLEVMLGSGWNELQTEFFHDHLPRLFDGDQTYFQTAAIILIAGNLAIVIFGLIYELFRNKTFILPCGNNEENNIGRSIIEQTM